MDDWGTQIRLARVRAGITQGELSAATGVTQATISRIESGRNWPSKRTVDALLDHLRGIQPEEAMSVPGAQLVAASKAGTGHGELTELVVEELLGSEPTPIDWVVEGFAARGAVTMLAGRYGQGKSLLAQSLAVCVAEGSGEVAGFVCEPGRSMILDAENGPDLIHARLKGLGLTAHGAQHLRAVTARSFDMERDEDKLRLALAANPPDLLVLDTWTSLWRGSEASVEQVQDCLNMLRQVARDFGLAVILLHHTTKSGEGFRGSGAIGATIEGVFLMDRPHEEEQTLRAVTCEKLRIAAEPPARWFHVGYPLTEADGYGS